MKNKTVKTWLAANLHNKTVPVHYGKWHTRESYFQNIISARNLIEQIINHRVAGLKRFEAGEHLEYFGIWENE